jgi:hypothetical protein
MCSKKREPSSRKSCLLHQREIDSMRFFSYHCHMPIAHEALVPIAIDAAQGVRVGVVVVIIELRG